MKKDIETVIGIGLIALLMSILFYPLLHETGHIISSLIVGGKIVKFNMIPPASVICDMKNVSDIGIIIVGISGNLFPTIVCILMYTVNKYTFWFWYTRLNLCAICTLSYAVALMNILIFNDINDDIIKIISMYPDTKPLCIIICVVFIAITLFFIITSNIIKNFDKKLIENMEEK